VLNINTVFEELISDISIEGRFGDAKFTSSPGRFRFQYKIPSVADIAVPLRSKKSSSNRIPESEVI